MGIFVGLDLKALPDLRLQKCIESVFPLPRRIDGHGNSVRNETLVVSQEASKTRRKGTPPSAKTQLAVEGGLYGA
jgi:hypothetical protein